MEDETNITEAQLRTRARAKRRRTMLMQYAMMATQGSNAAAASTPPSGAVGLDFSDGANSQYLTILFAGTI